MTRQLDIQKTISLVLIGISEKFFQILKMRKITIGPCTIAARGSKGVDFLNLDDACSALFDNEINGSVSYMIYTYDIINIIITPISKRTYTVLRRY